MNRLYAASWAIISGVSLLVMGIFIALGWYAYPSADDFCMAANARDYGLLNYLWQHYVEWSGRYSGNALYGLYPTVFGLFTGYPWLAGLMILSLLGAAAFLLATLLQISLTNRTAWLVALIFVATYLLGLRHTASSLYWLAGTMTYHSAHIVLLVLLALLVRLHRRQQRGQDSAGLIAGSVLLLVLGVGANELSMIVLTLLMAILYLIQRYSRPAHSAPWLLLLVVTLTCAAAVYFAPGNSIREATFPMRHDLVNSIEGSLRMGGWTLMVWTGTPVFFVGTLLTPFAAGLLRQSHGFDPHVSAHMLLALAAVTFATPFVLQFPAWWAMGGWPPPRTVDAIFFLFALSWFALVGALSLRFLPTGFLSAVDGRVTARAAGLQFLVAVLFVFAVLVNGKLQRAWVDLTERAAPFRQYMMQRHELIQQAKDSGAYSLQAPAFQGELPHAIYFNDIRPDWRDWRNVCYARYFGLRAIQRDRGRGIDRSKQPTNDAPL